MLLGANGRRLSPTSFSEGLGARSILCSGGCPRLVVLWERSGGPMVGKLGRESNNMRTEILTRLIIVGLGSEDYL